MKKELKWNQLVTEDNEHIGRIAVTPDKKLVIVETKDYIERKRNDTKTSFRFT